MKVKTFLVTARPSAREESRRSIDTAIDAAVNAFLGQNPGIAIEKYELAVGQIGAGTAEALVSIVYTPAETVKSVKAAK